MKHLKIVLLVLAIMMVCAVIIGCNNDSTDNPQGDGDTAATTTTRKTTTTKATTTTPEPLPPETPITGDEFADWETGYEAAVIESAGQIGLSPWGDGAIENAFDGADGYHELPEGATGATKLGGGTSGYLDIWFTLETAKKIEAYAFITGGDSAQYTGRTPIAWKLYGSNTAPDEGGEGEWTLIDQVDDGVMEDVDNTPFGYTVDDSAVAEYKYLKIEFIRGTNGGATLGDIQLNEILFYTKK